MDVVIPYGHGGRWEELRYFLRSIEPLKARITIYSQSDIDWIKNVNVIKTDRWYPEHIKKKWSGMKLYENYFDVLNKLRLASENEELDEDIVWCYDDQVMLEPDFSVRYMPNYRFEPGRHSNTIKKALGLKEGKVFETHLPRVFRRDKLRTMFSGYELEKVPYAPSTLYYNLFKGDYVKGVDNRVRYDNDFYPESVEQINDEVKGKSWINYDNVGLNSFLKEWIVNKFPNKSIYER